MSCSEREAQNTGVTDHCLHTRDGYYRDWVCCWCGDLFVDVEDEHGEYKPKPEMAGLAINDILKALAIVLCHYGRDLDIEEPESFRIIDGILREHTGVGIWETQHLGFDAIVKSIPVNQPVECYTCGKPNCKPQNHAGWNPNDEGHG